MMRLFHAVFVLLFVFCYSHRIYRGEWKKPMQISACSVPCGEGGTMNVRYRECVSDSHFDECDPEKREEEVECEVPECSENKVQVAKDRNCLSVQTFFDWHDVDGEMKSSERFHHLMDYYSNAYINGKLANVCNNQYIGDTLLEKIRGEKAEVFEQLRISTDNERRMRHVLDCYPGKINEHLWESYDFMIEEYTQFGSIIQHLDNMIAFAETLIGIGNCL